jgi:hypothetical protein
MKSSKRKRENHQKTDDISSELNKQAFTEIVTIIQSARQTALASVNITHIDFYWRDPSAEPRSKGIFTTESVKDAPVL